MTKKVNAGPLLDLGSSKKFCKLANPFTIRMTYEY